MCTSTVPVPVLLVLMYARSGIPSPVELREKCQSKICKMYEQYLDSTARARDLSERSTQKVARYNMLLTQSVATHHCFLVQTWFQFLEFLFERGKHSCVGNDLRMEARVRGRHTQSTISSSYVRNLWLNDPYRIQLYRNDSRLGNDFENNEYRKRQRELEYRNSVQETFRSSYSFLDFNRIWMERLISKAVLRRIPCLFSYTLLKKYDKNM